MQLDLKGKLPLVIFHSPRSVSAPKKIRGNCLRKSDRQGSNESQREVYALGRKWEGMSGPGDSGSASWDSPSNLGLQSGEI